MSRHDMTDTDPTGTFETRFWSSRRNPRVCGDISTFVPHPPRAPGKITDPANLAEAELALARLNASPSAVRIRQLLSDAEAIASSRFEGVARPTAQVLDAARADHTSNIPTLQIVGNIHSMRETLEPTETVASHDLLHRWHRNMIGPTTADDTGAGAYRETQNWIGYWGSTPLNATYVPPPPDLVTGLMDDLVDFCNDRTLSPVVHAAIAHAHFETIHPFGDGNGRVGRVLIYRLLSSRGAISVPPPISPLLHDARDMYITGLTAYRDGRPDIWINTFAQLLTDASAYGLLVASAIDKLNEEWATQLSDVRAGSVDHRIVAHLVDLPVLDASGVASRFNVSTTAARDALLRLAARGIISERSPRRGRRGRPALLFEAAELIDLLDENPQVLAVRSQRKQQLV